jgi:hypothetical protein
MTYDEFCDHYKPTENTLTGNGNAFETYGAEQDLVFATDEKFVWTEVDGDGGCYIIAGRHYVNRIQYYICEVPWDDDNQEVVVQLYKDCDTCGCTGGYGTMDDGSNCPECSVDTDAFNIYPERKDLIEIFGEEYANVQV